MKLTELKARLAAEAKAKGICKEWYDFILAAPSKDRLLTLFVKGLDFCLTNDFPSPELRAEFDDARRERGIFINDEIEAKSLRKIIAFRQTYGSAEFANFDVAEIYARDDSQLTIKATGNAYISVDVADRALVHIEATDAARVSVFLHGGNCTYDATGNAKIKITDKRR